MKIIYIANVRLPTERAHGVQIMKMCEAFADLGNEVELVVPRRKNNIKDDVFEYYMVRKNFKVVKLQCLDTVRFGFLGFLLEWFSFAGLAFWHLLFNKSDVYFGRDYITLLYLSFLKRKTIWETHTGEWNILVWLFTKIGKNIIVISNGLKDFYVLKGVSPQKITVAHDGVDLLQFGTPITKEEARRKLDLPEKDKVVMYIGSLQSWKGVDTFLNASKLAENTTFVVIGGNADQIKKLKKDYDNVTFLGEKPYKDLPINQKAADVLVIPNTARDKVSKYFTSPLKVFAHMASGVPILASDIPSLREILSEKNAFFFEADDAEDLSKKIILIKENVDEAEKRAEQALKDVCEHTWEKRAEKILSFKK